MSADNVDVVRAMNAAFNAGDVEGMLAPCDPDVEWRDLMHAPDQPERVRGIQALGGILHQYDEAFGRFTAQVEEYIGVGESVVTVTSWHAVGRDSGLPVDARTAELYELRGGRVLRITQGYADREAALAGARAAARSSG
jgi:ketosteroid isomerase-like protein